ncbi:MAG: NAD(P)-dependent oxidoreductase [Burkholderiales bacterium]|nr:NAD(P)-dependent oxidoreductase [Burkholderiales bacterium]
MKIGFIGLGQMGRGMASRLLDTGYPLSVWNRSREIAETFRLRGAVVAERPEQLLDADVVITMLADDAAVEAVWIASGLVQKLPASTIHLNMASVSLRLGQRLTQMHRAAGTQYVSAPVFGRPEPAASGQLDIVAAGAADAIARCAPLFEALGRRWFNVGTEAYYANIVKIARNFLNGAIIESLGEAFALVQKSGVDPAMFLDIITSTSMNSPAYKTYGRMILDRPAATFPLTLGLKDVELALQAGNDTAVPLPLAALLKEQHLAAIACGYGDKDWASLGNYIAERAGL